MLVLGIDAVPGAHKVVGAEYLYVVEKFHSVGIVESAVENGYRHALAAKTEVVQPVSVEHLNLFLCESVVFRAEHDRIIKLAETQGVQRRGIENKVVKNFLHAVHTRQGGKAFKPRAVFALHQGGVVPFAHAKHLASLGSYFAYIFRAHRQIVVVNLYFPFCASLQRLFRQEFRRFAFAIGRFLLVLEVNAVFINSLLRQRSCAVYAFLGHDSGRQKQHYRGEQHAGVFCFHRLQ